MLGNEAGLAFDLNWKDENWRSRVRKSLTKWFDANQRTLPWRNSRDPYKVWISEIMLQQTQVATVIPYFIRFLERFPNVQQLAEAPVEEVLRFWEGLGYYRRARQMHEAAKLIVLKYGGDFPSAFEHVLGLPGIGRYTAGAILSIACDQRLPVVEANTLRLYSRLIALRLPVTSREAKENLWAVAEALLPRSGCGRFNQAAMELGALICTPRQPKCEVCPLAVFCPTRAAGLQDQIPGKIKTTVYEERHHAAVIVQSDKTFFLRVCKPGTHWESLWDFPRYDITEQKKSGREIVEQLFYEEFGWSIRLGDELAELRHGVTKYKITLTAYRASMDTTLSANKRELVREFAGSPLYTPADSREGWFDAKQIGALPLNTTGRKLAKMVASVNQP